MTGFFKDSLSGDYADREVYWYIPETAVLRPYYHFIAVPNDVDPGEFLIESGWKQISDETGECLFVLVPGETGKWGELEYEKGYMAAARTKHGGVGSYFTTFGEFYLVGYGEGAAPLEAWAAENPNLVIAQSYIGGTSVGADILEAAGEVSFGWNQMTDGDRATDEEGRQRVLKQMTERLKTFLHPDLNGFEGLLTKDDMVVPTWLINTEGEDSLIYWKKVNRATGDEPDQTFGTLGGVEVAGEVFKQKDDTWSTEYAGRISKVTTVETEEDVISYEFSRALRDDMTDYTRYDVTISYGNGLTYRMDYTDLQVERYTSPNKEAKGRVVGKIVVDGEDREIEGELTIKLFPVGTGTAKSDMVLYVPETAGDSKIPVVVVSHGATQTANLFMDSTTWWQTAAREGFAIVLATRTTWTGASRINNNDVFDVIMDWLEADGRFDMGRIYATGQSAGGSATFGYAKDYTDKLAAVYWSNSPGSVSTAEGTNPIPAGMFIGDGNYSNRGIPMFNNKEEADAAGAVIYWDDIGTDASPAGIEKWKRYFYSANGIGQENISDTIIYRGGNAMNRGLDNPNGTIAEWQTNNARYRTFTWTKDFGPGVEDIPVLSYTLSLYQAHNNLPGYNAIMWDFMKHYRVEVDENNNVKRYYSPSGFVEDDEVEIFAEEAEPGLKAINFDEVEAPTTFDKNKANKLPLNGYFEKTLAFDGETRTAKVYLPEGIPVRAYYTVIAVADDVDTEEFLEESGWIALADEREEGLFILEPGNDGWGSYEEEMDYVNAAIGFFSSNSYFSIFGEHYFVGYGAGAPVLEAWAAANPLKVIGQVYVNSQGLNGEYLNQFASIEFDGKNGNYVEIEFPEGFEKITYNEALLPTWYINPDSAYIDSFNYWKEANDCEATPVSDDEFGEIYPQKVDSLRWMTSHSGPISKVALLNDEDFNVAGTAERIYDFLSYYTRYENAVAYGNQLSVRADYDKLGIEIRTMEVEGELREYLVYVPENSEDIWGQKAPAVVVFPGNSQTDKVFLDATQWWQVAEKEGFVLAIVCEQNNIPAATTVSHKNSKVFYEQLREVLIDEYNVDSTRIYATGQSAGSNISQTFAAAFPEYFAAVASTSGAAAPSGGKVTMDGVSYAASGKPIPNYFIYGAGDNVNMKGTLWDDITNGLDSWAAYHLEVNGFELVDEEDYVVSGWMDRFRTWTWTKEFEGIDVEIFKVTRNMYRSHNCISEEMPMLWDFMRHYSVEVDENNHVKRYYSPSGFVEDDKIVIYEDEKVTSDIENISVTTVPDDFGQRLKSVEITYSADVDDNLEVDDFEVRYQTNNLTLEYVTYTPDSVSVNSNIVTLNFDDRRAGFVVGNYYYYDGNDEMKNITARLDLYDAYIISVVQLRDVTSDGKVISSGSQVPVQANNYTHSVLEDFQYVHLTDEQAALILQDVDFANNNAFGDADEFIQELIDDGYIDATEDASLIQAIRESLPMGDLNEVCLEGYGVNIWYHLPENYTPENNYPMFVYNHGSGECWNTVMDRNGAVIDNRGVHIAVNRAPMEWAITGEKGLEDVIVICVQYLNGNNGANLPYDRDDAIRAGMFYMIKNFGVDVDRIYASGTSQGAGRTSALVRDCADWIAGAIIQNGGYSSAISNYGIDRSALARMWSIDDCTDLAVKIHEYTFEFAASQDVALWFFQGENDSISRPLISLTMYKAFLNLYQEAGKSADWLEDNLRYTMFDNVVYDAIGETSYHSSIKPTYYFYAYYDDEAYEAVYDNADGTQKYGDRNDPENDALNNYDTKYGSNDPNGYGGLIDWALSKSKDK